MSELAAATPPAPEAAEGPAGLYVHIPFCLSKCPYCAFVSQPGPGEALLGRYLAALHRQAEALARHPWLRGRSFDTLFVGGGTPTVYGGRELGGFIKRCLELFRFSAEPEISVETNPNTVTEESLAALRAAGANRLSIGIQSLDDTVLGALGRTHTAAEAVAAVQTARLAGFDNLSLDLMYGLPGQDGSSWTRTIDRALALAPEHLSVYELTIEEGTPFAARAELGLPDEELRWQMDVLLQEKMAASGLERYEISNYARPGRRCRHNTTYWENGSYLGLGAAAVSCLSGCRLRTVEDAETFIERTESGKTVFTEAECLGREPRFRETVIMGLRTTGGVSLSRLTERFGLDPVSYYGPVLEALRDQGLVVRDHDRLRLSKRGLALANLVLAELV